MKSYKDLTMDQVAKKQIHSIRGDGIEIKPVTRNPQLATLFVVPIICVHLCPNLGPLSLVVK
ncbi:MAG: hypothetical protein ABIF87_16480 [Pseudomonadota bacterium]|jgi:hypothetical protein